jgi:translation elongation factor EF-1alpha
MIYIPEYELHAPGIIPIKREAFLMTNEATEGKKQVGEVTHFFGKISVAAIKITQSVKVGDTISIEGATTNFEQQVDSMQIQNEDITEAPTGSEIGIRVKDRVRVGDKVYLVK